MELDEKDISDAHHISRMMESKGWAIFTRYLAFARESFIDSGKKGIKSRAGRDLSPIKWGILTGFDEFIAIPQRIVTRAEEFVEGHKNKQEESNGTQHLNGE